LTLYINRASINYKEKDKLTALHHAVFERKYAIAHILLKYGASVNERSEDLRTPLHFASIIGDGEICKLLLDFKADTNPQDSQGNTPVHYAALYGMHIHKSRTYKCIKIIVRKKA